MATLKESALRRFVSLEAFPQPPLIPAKAPVVLMHGFGLLAGLRRGGHLHDTAMDLRLCGVRAYAPNVAPYNTIEVRAAMWKERLAYVLEETGADQLTLIAHSMGGLDARYLISALGLHEVVGLLVTVSTPHHGTTLAEIMLNQPERLRKWGVELANWMGANSLEDATADALQALTELTPVHIRETFNPAVPDHPSVAYWSYAGAAGKGTETAINPLLRWSNAMIYQSEGVNDGMVSVESARWGVYQDTLDADHGQEIGLQVLPGKSFDANGFYRAVVERLAEAGY